MDISALTLFIEVVRQGSFAAVARDRSLDPSSISRAIASLETELGVRLFQRTTRKLSLTEAGAIYLDRIEPLVDDLLQAGAIAKELTGQPKGTLRVTASVSFGLTCIVPLLPTFEARYPELTVELLLTDRVVDLLAERIDVAVRLGQLKDSTLIAQRLIPVSYRVCASPAYLKQHGHPRTPKEIEQHNCLVFPLSGFRSLWRLRDSAGAISEVRVNGNTVISNAIALQHCAVFGMGLALLPDWLVDTNIENKELVDLFAEYEATATDFNTAAWLVYPSRAYVPLKSRLLMDFLKQALDSR